MEGRGESDAGSTTESEYYDESDDNAPQNHIKTEDATSTPSPHAVATHVAVVEASQTLPKSVNPPQWSSVLASTTLETTPADEERRRDHDQSPTVNTASVSFAELASSPVVYSATIAETEQIMETVGSETCPVCHVQVKPVEYPQGVSKRCVHSFCACCRRVLLDRSYTKSERRKGLARRCFDCAPHSPTSMIPVRDRSLLISTRSAASTLKQRYEWRRRADPSLVLDPRVGPLDEEVEALEERKLIHVDTVRLALQHGDATIAYSHVLYEEALVLDEQELALREREVALYTEVIESHSDNQEVEEVDTKSVKPLTNSPLACDCCSASLCYPPGPGEDDARVKAVICTCCCLVLPPSSFDNTQLEVNCSYPRCTTCIQAKPNANKKHLHKNWPHLKTMNALFSILWKFRKQVSAEGKRVTQPFDAFLKAEAESLPAHAELKLQQKALGEVNAQNRKLVNGIGLDSYCDRLQLSRELYRDVVQTQAAIVRILPLLFEQLERLFTVRRIAVPPRWQKATKAAKLIDAKPSDDVRVAKKPRLD